MTPGERLERASLLVEGERIVAVNPPGEVLTDPELQTLDAGGNLLVPGLIELHINGGFGLDFTANPESI